MRTFSALLVLSCSLLAVACDSSSASTSSTKAEAKGDRKAGDGKAAGKGGDDKAAPKADDAAVIAEAKKAAMTQCSLQPNDFTVEKMQTSKVLAGSILHVWTQTGPSPREHRSFVAKKAMVRAVTGDMVEIYITTDDSDPCSLPKSNTVNVAKGPVVISKDGNEVVQVTLAKKTPGKYFGRTAQEAVADMMGGPENWVAVGYTVKDAVVKEFNPDDPNPKFPYASLNSEGRSHIDVTKLELGKKLEANIHACLGGEDFLIGPIDAGFCPDAIQATP